MFRRNQRRKLFRRLISGLVNVSESCLEIEVSFRLWRKKLHVKNLLRKIPNVLGPFVTSVYSVDEFLRRAVALVAFAVYSAHYTIVCFPALTLLQLALLIDLTPAVKPLSQRSPSHVLLIIKTWSV